MKYEEEIKTLTAMRDKQEEYLNADAYEDSDIEALAHQELKALNNGIEAMRTVQQMDNPQPLMQEELKGMVGKPIFIELLHTDESYWDICTGDTDNHNESWIAYAHEPKQEVK